MRRPAVPARSSALAALAAAIGATVGAACGGSGSAGGAISLVLDLPDGMLDPEGYTAVEIVLHEPGGDVTRTTSVDSTGAFSLERVDPSASASIEATLRNDIGAAVGYGRTMVGTALAAGAQIVVPVRRPIAYLAGTVSRDPDNNPNSDPGVRLHWSEAAATYSDLSVPAPLDGSAQLGSNALLMITAGPNLYLVTQAIDQASGALTGAAQILPVSSADHQVGAALSGTMTGAALDGAGADDGSALAIGTASQLFAIDTATGAARALADGSFARVAIVTGAGDGELDTVAIRNRGATTGACATTAELWWAPLTGASAGAAHMVATGGFSDVAADRGHAYYVDACSGELGEVTASGVHALRTIPGTGSAAGAAAGKPTALAVSNGQAYIGVETPPAMPSAPATASLLVAPIAAGDPRTLWTEAAQQVIDVPGLTDVQRLLSASSIALGQLVVGAGGDYVALTTSARFHGAAISQVNFPDTTIDTEELRVFDAATGGLVQRYRSWCEGSFTLTSAGEIDAWECAAASGQSTPASDSFDHHINSMTFAFGKQ